MALYSEESILLIIIASVPALISLYLYFVKRNLKSALVFLVLSGFLLRLLMAFIDPYLHDWDERFHALVAKHMMTFPFKPMLRVTPIMPFKIEDWCCNHIWLHKQPLFLWQMALSMKFFGINEVALRLPSVFMGTISIFFVFDISRYWTKNLNVAYLAALFLTFSFYQLELTSGRYGSDHNDIAFSFYVTASIWGFIKYLKSNYSIKWGLLIGVFVGAAVLNKWLTGILIFGGWTLFLLISKELRRDSLKWKHLVFSIITAVIVFLPWQIYISTKFPVESSIMYEYNRKHIFEVVEGHRGDIWYYVNSAKQAYGKFLLPFILLGIYSLVKDKSISKKLSIAFLSMVVVIYGFFSIIVQTKMSAFTYPVNSIIWTLIALGLFELFFVIKIERISKFAIQSVLLLLMIYTVKPWRISEYRDRSNGERNKKIHNTMVYLNLDKDKETFNRVILNCKSFDNLELMFYKDVIAYSWFPHQETLDSLLSSGYKFAAFKSHNNQQLPAYIVENKDILIIDEEIE